MEESTCLRRLRPAHLPTLREAREKVRLKLRELARGDRGDHTQAVPLDPQFSTPLLQAAQAFDQPRDFTAAALHRIHEAFDLVVDAGQLARDRHGPVLRGAAGDSPANLSHRLRHDARANNSASSAARMPFSAIGAGTTRPFPQILLPRFQ